MLIQLIGLIAVILLCISSFIKTKESMLMYQLIACLILSLHYLLLGGYTGSILELILVITTFTCSRRIKNKNIFMIILSLINIIICIITFNAWYCIIPTLVCIMMTWCLIYGNKLALRLGMLISSIGWALYSFFIGSYSVFISNIIMAAIIIYIIRGDSYEK